MTRSQIDAWARIGESISAHPKESLAALFGDGPAIEFFSGVGLLAPTLELLRADPSLDPNPHQLALPSDYVEMCFRVRVLALWGPTLLIDAAIACAELQVERQPSCAPRNREARDAALRSALSYQERATDAAVGACRSSAEGCANIYERHAEAPDSPAAMATWNDLGAPWFAAEAIAQDYTLTEWDGDPPREASRTWGNRMSVWTQRAADAAAHWTSSTEVMAALKSRVLARSLS